MGSAESVRPKHANNQLLKKLAETREKSASDLSFSGSKCFTLSRTPYQVWHRHDAKIEKVRNSRFLLHPTFY